jgi:hypothetical protein
MPQFVTRHENEIDDEQRKTTMREVCAHRGED